MHKGYHEAEQHQEEESADTVAVNHVGCEGWTSDRARSFQNSTRGNFKMTLGEEREESTGVGELGD